MLRRGGVRSIDSVYEKALAAFWSTEGSGLRWRKSGGDDTSIRPEKRGVVLVRTLCWGLLVAAIGAAPAAAQTPTAANQPAASQGANAQNTTTGSDSDTRPALPTFYGDTGLWFVPTAETLPKKKFSGSLFRANYDRPPVLTDISHFGVTAAYGVTDRFEVFADFSVVRLDRDTHPFFQTDAWDFGGIVQEFPYLRRGFSKTIGGPTIIGGKYALLAQSKGDAMSLAPRLMVTLPFGSKWSGTTRPIYNRSEEHTSEL